MEEKKKYMINVNGTSYPITTEESEEYVNRLEYFLNSRIRNMKEKTGIHLSDSLTLGILAIGLADDMFRLQKQYDTIADKAGQLMKEYDKTVQVNGEYIEKISELEGQINELKTEVLKLQTKLEQ